MALLFQNDLTPALYYKSMDQIVYDRPREKLRDRGAQSLTLAELLQVIIGSGSRGSPVAKLAREAAYVIETSLGQDATKRLMNIRGIGAVKVAQITAAIELAGRIARANSDPGLLLDDDWLMAVGRMKKVTIRFCLLAGDGSLLDRGEYTPKRAEHYLFAARQVIKRSLAAGAESLSIVIGSVDNSGLSSLFERGFYRAIYEQSTAVQVRVVAARIVCGRDARIISRKDLAM